jgi:hypothetical protein
MLDQLQYTEKELNMALKLFELAREISTREMTLCLIIKTNFCKKISVGCDVMGYFSTNNSKKN